jgi:RHS repeat-associated protein
VKSCRCTNRETSVVVSPKAYQYDANGNLTNDGRMAYFWNDENRLVAVRSAKTGALIQENRYDGLGRRREKIEHGADGVTTNRYLYQDWMVLAVTDGDGNLLETYTHGADLSGQVGGGAGGIGGILASTQDVGEGYYHYDFNGNVVNVSSSNQTQLAKYTYGPFGEVLLKEGAFDSRYQFSTKELDGSTGMNYYGYRYYSSGLGRWVNRDPIEKNGGLNIYGFVMNSPVERLDPVGLAQQCTLSTDSHSVNLVLSQLHKVIGPGDQFPWYRLEFFNTLKFPVNCLKCKKGDGPTATVTADIYGDDKMNISSLENDFQILLFDGGTCDENGSATVSVQTRTLVRLGGLLDIILWRIMHITLRRTTELCYECVPCK